MNIETERLTLRPITIADDQDIFEYSKDPAVGKNAGWAPHKTLEQTREIMAAVFVGVSNVFGIVNKKGKLIGSVGLVEDKKRQYDNVLMLGYAIGEAHWGQGYMTEAARAILEYGFGVLEADIISAYCYPENSRSRNVLLKCGFLYEGTLRRAETLFDGSVKDNLCFSITKEEYVDNNG